MKYLQKIYTTYFHYLKLQLIAVLLLLFAVNSFAQQVYPVLSNVQVSTPYSSYLSDYAGAASTKLQVNLFLKDLSKTNYACRLRVKIEGFGITIQSKNDFSVQALMINGGELSVISGSQLEPYFNPQNLVFQGMSQAEFTRSGGKLPEGIYRFSVEVLDYYRKNQVSNSGMAVVSIFLAYPPIINQPLNGSKVNPLDPQNVVFQWTPRNAASLNGAYNIAYKFKLAELIPADRDPNDAIRTTRPLYETYTDQTLLVYGIAEPQLTPGNSYAVQVQAIEAEGKDLFVNGGNSEVAKFTYGDKCAFPFSISAELTASDAIKVSWNAQPLQQAFTIRYREAQKANAQWFEQETYTPDYTIQGLRPNTTYEYQVKSQCIYGYGDYSQSQSFTMPDEDLSKGDFVCGKAEENTAAEQGEPLPILLPNTIFFAGKFPVTVTSASGTDGTFSGTGTVGLPFLNFLSFKVAFNNIRINDKLKMTEGKIVFVRQTLDQSIDQVIAANTITPDANGNVTATNSALPNIIDAAIQWPGPLPTYNQQTNTVKFTSTITDDNGTTTTKEITIQLTENQPPYTFQDKNGETFQVDQQGKVEHLGKIPASQYLAGNNTTSQQLDTKKAQVTFAPPVIGHKYGFDTYNESYKANSKYTQDYQSLNDPNNKDQRVSWKSIESGQTDQVIATFTNPDKTLDPNKLEFRTGTGEKLSATITTSTSSTNPTYTINLIGALAGNTKEIYAVYPKQKGQIQDSYLGKLNIASYQKLSKKVVIVPVNGAGADLDANQLKDQLNEIYKQAITNWEVELATNFQADSKYDNLETASSDALSAYTDGQKALISAYKQQNQLKDNTYYIFIVKQLSDQSEGYMVRGGQVGFVATTNSRTIAHELSHGAFMLKHTFEDPGLKKGSTNNLMDYSQTGTELWHSQWQYMRNPDIIFRPFEGDESGAYETDGHYSTVYLVSLMLGMDKEKAKQLATATEAPDTKIHSPMDYELNQTWIYPGVQQEVHSLTGKFHGIEEFITALKILYTSDENLKHIGELLHRFGDTYAHTKLDNIKPSDIDSYQLDPNNVEMISKAIESWRGQGAVGLAKKIEPWIDYFNYYLKKFGLKFLSDKNLQKQYLHNRTLEQILRDVYLINPTDKFQMYGSSYFTTDHATSDGGYPDLIYMRPKWYLSYVKNLAWILSVKYKLNEKNLSLDVFNKMVDFAIKEKCSLKGIIDYEIAKKIGKKELFIPVFYSKSNMLAASFDAIKNTDYYQVAKDATAKTKKYILQDGKKDVTINPEKDWNIKINIGTGFFRTLAFKIQFK